MHEAGRSDRMNIPIYRSQLQTLTCAIAAKIEIFQNNSQANGLILSKLFDKYRELEWRESQSSILSHSVNRRM